MLSLSSSEENKHRVFRSTCCHRGQMLQLVFLLTVVIWTLLLIPPRAWRETMGRARKRVPAAAMPHTGLSRSKCLCHPSARCPNPDLAEATSPRQLCLSTQGELGRGLHFRGGVMGFITVCQETTTVLSLAKPRWPGSARLSQVLTSPLLTCHYPSVRPAPSSAGSLCVVPALPMQSIQCRAWSPTLGGTIIGK